VEWVEEGGEDEREAEALVRLSLEPLLEKGMDTLVLGCTHFPFLMRAIRAVVAEEVEIVEPGVAVARHVAKQLGAGDLSHGVGRNTAEKAMISPHFLVTQSDEAYLNRLKALWDTYKAI